MRPNKKSSIYTHGATIDLYDRCFNVFEEARSLFMQFDGVLGMGLGPKERGQHINPHIPCLIVYVSEKKDLTQIPFYQIIPRAFRSVSTDVVVPGKRLIAAHNSFDASWLKWDADKVTSEKIS